jgi:protein phosphatase
MRKWKQETVGVDLNRHSQKYEYTALVSRGINRSINSDRVCVGDKIIEEGGFSSSLEGCLLCAVFDGVGCSQGGEKAAQLAAEQFAADYQSFASNSDSSRTLFADGQMLNLKSSLENINASILALQKSALASRRASTTIAGICVNGKRLCVFSAGDSRAYRFRDGELSQLTYDHTVSQVMKESGLGFSDKQLASASPVITRYLGDSRGGRGPVEFSSIQNGVAPGDLFLLCTDGLTGIVDDNEIKEALRRAVHTKLICDALVSRAQEKGSTDDIAILLVRVLPWLFG